MNNDKQFIPYKVLSKNREAGTPINDTTIYLHSLDQANENYQLHLRNFVMNHDFYNINSNNNLINFQTDIGTTSVILQDLNLTLPIQNYNSAQFITGFNTQAPLSGITGLVATFNNQTNKLTYINNSGTNLLLNTNENQKFLGLSPNTYDLGTTNTSIVSNVPTDFSGINEINVILENIDLESYSTQDYNKNIFATIPIETNFNEKIIYNNDYPVTTNNKNINRLRIKLIDEFGDLIPTESEYMMNLQFIQDGKK